MVLKTARSIKLDVFINLRDLLKTILIKDRKKPSDLTLRLPFNTVFSLIRFACISVPSLLVSGWWAWPTVFLVHLCLLSILSLPLASVSRLWVRLSAFAQQNPFMANIMITIEFKKEGQRVPNKCDANAFSGILGQFFTDQKSMTKIYRE